MEKLDFVADGVLLARLRSLARRKGVSESELVRRALKEYIRHANSRDGLPSFVGAGASGGKFCLSELAGELR